MLAKRSAKRDRANEHFQMFVNGESAYAAWDRRVGGSQQEAR